MAGQIKVCTGVDSFQLFESEREPEFNIACGVGIMCQLVVIVVPVHVFSQAKGQVPAQSHLLPVCIPLHFLSRLDEELHFHLLEFPHSENKLPGNNLVAERFPGLGYPKRDLHSPTFLDIQEIHENALCRFRSQVYERRPFFGAAQLCAEHQVEFPHLGPVF